MDTLAVVNELHRLSSNPKNRASIVTDQGCLPGLVLFLDNENIQVVYITLKTLALLAQHAPNRKHMKEELGLLPSLKALIEKPNIDPQIKRMATDVSSLILNNRQLRSTSRTNQQFFLGNVNKRAKVVTLKINGMRDISSRRVIEEKLVRVKGVISITFDSSKKNRCIIRIRQDVTAEMLCKAIGETKIMSAQQIIKKESGEEVVLHFGKMPIAMDDEKPKEQQDLPDYLPEDDDVVVNEKAVRRLDDKENGNRGGWFTGVSNFISKTLYW